MGRFASSAFDLDVPEVLGAFQIGLSIALILFGIALVQTYIYYQQRSKDVLALKVLVAVVMVLETTHSITGIYSLYLLIIPTSDNETPAISSYPLSTNILVENAITVIVQCYYIYRIYRLSKSLSVSCICWFLSFLRFVGGTVLAVVSYQDVPRRDGFHVPITFGWLVTTTFAITATVDVMIAGLMVFYLRKIAAPSKSKSTLDMVHRLMLWSLRTGLTTGIMSVVTLACFQGMQNFVWLGFYEVLAKLYTNSLLVSLNVRPILTNETSKTFETLQFVNRTAETNSQNNDVKSGEMSKFETHIPLTELNAPA